MRANEVNVDETCVKIKATHVQDLHIGGAVTSISPISEVEERVNVAHELITHNKI